jgi:hypothetical protein
VTSLSRPQISRDSYFPLRHPRHNILIKLSRVSWVTRQVNSRESGILWMRLLDNPFYTRMYNYTQLHYHNHFHRRSRWSEVKCRMRACFCSSWSYTKNWLVWVWVSFYDRRSVGKSVLAWSTHLGLVTRPLLLFDNYGLVFFVGALSDKRAGQSVVYAAGSRQRSLYGVRVH